MSDTYGYQPTGLAGFFQQPEFGTEVGERLGVIGEILGRLGSGQGMAGISSTIGAVNQRSSERRDKRRMFQMVNRAADKIQATNPELADMMRANPAWGMEVLGKQMLNKDDFAFREKLQGMQDQAHMDRLIKEKGLEAQAVREKLAAEQARMAEFWKGIGVGGGSGPVTPPVTAPVTAPEPSPDQASVKTPTITAITPVTTESVTPLSAEAPVPAPGLTPPGMGAGQGNEPAPSQVPVPGVPETAPGKPGPIEPLPQQIPIPFPEVPISPNPRIAQMQQALSQSLNMPVTPIDVTNLMSATNPAAAGTILANMQKRWDDYKAMVSGQQFQKSERVAGQDFTVSQADRARLQKQQDEQAAKLAADIERANEKKRVAGVVDTLLADPTLPPGDKAILEASKLDSEGDLAGHLVNLSKIGQDRFNAVNQAAQFNRTETRLDKAQDLEKSRLTMEEQEFANKQKDRATAETAKQAAKVRVEEHKQTMAANALRLTDDVVTAAQKASLPIAGPMGYALSYLGSKTGAGEVSGSLESIRSDQFLTELKALKEESAALGGSGSSLGQVTEREIGALEVRISNLSQYTNDPDKLLTEIKSITNMKLDMLYGAGKGPFRLKEDGSETLTKIDPKEAVKSVETQKLKSEVPSQQPRQPGKIRILEQVP